MPYVLDEGEVDWGPPPYTRRQIKTVLERLVALKRKWDEEEDRERRRRLAEIGGEIAEAARDQAEKDWLESRRQIVAKDREESERQTQAYLEKCREHLRAICREMERRRAERDRQRAELAEWHRQARARWALIGEEIYQDACQFERQELERRGVVRGKMPR